MITQAGFCCGSDQITSPYFNVGKMLGLLPVTDVVQQTGQVAQTMGRCREVNGIQVWDVGIFMRAA